jgi:hypothetical protein
MIEVMPIEADKIIGDIEAGVDDAAAASRDPEAARMNIGGERRVLRAIRIIVLAEMSKRLAP